MHGNGLVNSRVAHDIQNRCKGFFADDVDLFGHTYNRWLDKVSADVGTGLAPHQHLTTAGLGTLDGRQHRRHRCGGCQWPNQCTGVKGIADGNAGIGLDEALAQGLDDAFVDNQAPRSGTTLASGTHRPKQHRPYRHVEVGIGSDDDGVVATEFEDRFAKAPGDGLGYFAAGTGATGKRNQGQAGVFGHALANHGPITDRQGKDTSDAMRSHDAIGEMLHRHGSQRHQF